MKEGQIMTTSKGSNSTRQDLIEDFHSSFSQKIQDIHHCLDFSEEDQALQNLSYLHKMLNQASAEFLPTFDQQRCANQLNQIEIKFKAVKNATKANEPKKKFGFKKPLHHPKPSTPPPVVINPSSLSSPAIKTKEVQSMSSQGFNLNGLREVYIYPKLAGSSTQSLSLENISDSVIDLRHHSLNLASLSLNQISNSILISSALSSSLLCSNIQHSCLILLAQQIRVHHSTNVTFLVHTTTGPIIEHSSELVFAPYPYHLFPHSLNLDNSQNQSRHTAINDFNYPDQSTIKSPNYSTQDQSPVNDEVLSELLSVNPDRRYDDQDLMHFPLPENTQCSLSKVLRIQQTEQVT